MITRWESRTRGLGGDSHVDVSVLFFKPSSEQVIKLLNSFYNFVEKMLLNCAQLVVLIVSWLPLAKLSRPAAGRQGFLKKRGSAIKIQSTSALNCRRPTQFCERQSADNQYNRLTINTIGWRSIQPIEHILAAFVHAVSIPEQPFK